MTSEREAGSEGFKLSAEVKPFVPKFAAVTMAWSEPSEACVFPRYYTTCYPYVQEPPVDKQQIYIEDVPWDTSTCFSQCTSPNLTGSSSLEEYTSSCSLDAVPNIYAVTNFQGQNSSFRQDRGYTKQTPFIRKEGSCFSRRRPKDNETRLENKRPYGSDFSSRSMENSSYIVLHSRNPIKSDRPIKVMNGKFKQIPNTEYLPEPAFEMSLSEFPKLQELESNKLLDLQKHAWEPVGSAEGDKLPLTPPGKQAISTITKEGEGSLKKHFPARPLSSSSDPGIPQVHTNFFTETPLSWATVLSQTPKKITSVPASVLASSHSGIKKREDIPEDCKQSEAQQNASDSNLEETADKKKKKKKKKKAKANSEIQKLHPQSILIQQPPRIEDVDEFPDLAAAFDRKQKQAAEKISCLIPFTSDKAEVIPKVRFESHDHSQKELLPPKSDVSSARKTGIQDSPSSLDKRRIQELPKSNRKKSQIPVQLDLGDMLAVLEQKQLAEKSKQSPKPVVLSVGGAVTLPSKESVMVAKNPQGIIPHNPLDSTSPMVKKGKQREIPKPKKPTSLRKIILKEREQRKQQHILEQMAAPKNIDIVQQNAGMIPDDNADCKDSREESMREDLVDLVTLTPNSSEVFVKCTELSGSMQNSIVPTQLKPNFPKIHSRRFRDYCTQVLSKEVDNCVTDLLKELVRFQDRLYQKDPVRAKTKRRLVMGLREVLKHLKLRQLKCIIISPNCEKIQSKGGLDETLHLIIDSACEQNIPFVFALNRKALGHCLNKLVPVSVVGIFSYDGAQDYFHKMVELTMEARKAYKEMISVLDRPSVVQGNESDVALLNAHLKGSCALDTGAESLPDSDDDVPNYIKIWKQKLEEEYNPYILELGKKSIPDVLTLGVEETQ